MRGGHRLGDVVVAVSDRYILNDVARVQHVVSGRWNPHHQTARVGLHARHQAHAREELCQPLSRHIDAHALEHLIHRNPVVAVRQLRISHRAPVSFDHVHGLNAAKSGREGKVAQLLKALRRQTEDRSSSPVKSK